MDRDFLVKSRRGRLLPGDGELDVTGLIASVHQVGFDGPYCVEVNTPEFRALPVGAAAELAFQTSTAVLQAAQR